MVVKLLSGIEDELVCVQCGGFQGPERVRRASVQERRVLGQKRLERLRPTRGTGHHWKPLNPTLNHACHWDDERGVRATSAGFQGPNVVQ